MPLCRALAIGLFALAAAPLEARVVSYAPITAGAATPGVQPRAGRHVLLAEEMPPACSGCGRQARLVLYDATGAEPPRRVFPPRDGAAIALFALQERGTSPASILVESDADLAGENPQRYFRHLLSTDAGASWRAVDLGPNQVPDLPPDALETRDRGGPVSGGRGAAVLPGSDATPFVVAARAFWSSSGATLFAIDRNGAARALFAGAPVWSGYSSDVTLLGSDGEGTRWLVLGTPLDAAARRGVYQVDSVTGARKLLLDVSAPGAQQPVHGWVRADGRAYLVTLGATYPAVRRLLLADGGAPVEVMSASPAVEQRPPDYAPRLAFFAVPTADLAGAWIVWRDTDRTRLLVHRGTGAPAEELALPLVPPVEGLHDGTSGLLLQSERPRARRDGADSGLDPLVALWRPGSPPPAAWDEMLLFTGAARRFVHLDVDALASGEPFVFDSAFLPGSSSGGPSGGPSGGGDLLQEWGVVRSGLQQRLFVPAVARAPGAQGAFWKTDLVLFNADDAPVNVRASLLGGVGETSFALGAGEIRLVPDVLSALGVAQGAGSLLLVADPFRSVEATSRTYTAVPGGGTAGMGMPAVDAFAAASPGFPVFFAGGLGGDGFRTNAVLVDALGTGAAATLASATGAGAPRERDVTVPAGGRTQVDDVASFLGVPAADAGALRLAPTTGALVAGMVVVDQATSDPAWLAPDLPTSPERTIPAVVHASGAGGAEWRSDLFLFNPAAVRQTVSLSVKSWDQPETDQTVALVLQAGESRVERDVLWNRFRRWGVARLRVRSTGTLSGSDSVRVLTRVYALAPGGGGRGFALPPLNAFQSARAGEALTILGAVGGDGFRTNLALVELSGGAGVPEAVTYAVTVEVYDPRGTRLDIFTVNVPAAGGIQVSDLFRARGLGAGPAAALLRVAVPPRSAASPGDPNVAAYATLVDNASGDAVYLPPQLETP